MGIEEYARGEALMNCSDISNGLPGRVDGHIDMSFFPYGCHVSPSSVTPNVDRVRMDHLTPIPYEARSATGRSDGSTPRSRLLRGSAASRLRSAFPSPCKQ